MNYKRKTREAKAQKALQAPAGGRITLSEAEFNQHIQGGVDFGYKLGLGIGLIHHLYETLRGTITGIISTYYKAQLLPETQRATVMRELYRGNEGLPSAIKSILSAVDELDTAVKDYGPLLDEYLEGGINYAEIQQKLSAAKDIREALQALLRDNDPDNGELLRQAIAKHNPKSTAKNDTRLQELRKLVPRIGGAESEVAAEAKRLLKLALVKYGIEKGSHGYRDKARTNAIMLLFREQNARDVSELDDRGQEVYRYLHGDSKGKGAVRDARISQLLDE